MNKQYWNTVVLDGSISRGDIERIVDNSYTLAMCGAKMGLQP
jgi:predicted DNA-binding protein (MmcQ/YjbR family)